MENLSQSYKTSPAV